MSATAISMKSNRITDLKQVTERLKRNMDAELVTQKSHITEDTEVRLTVFEKFYFRNGSYATVTILLIKSGSGVSAEIIGSGGGEGIFNISWGANEDFANRAEQILCGFGFSRV